MPSHYAQRITVALAGNPNVGKSTLFNALTGLRQHTGNWPGKTVGMASGSLKCSDGEYVLVDLPGTYSLHGNSEDEKVAADYLSGGYADCTVVVCDATCLPRSLILALQVLQLTDRAVVCVNLIDEASRRGITVDAAKLSQCLDVPVVLTSAGHGKGLDRLLEAVGRVARGMPGLPKHWEDPVVDAQTIAQCVTQCDPCKDDGFRYQVDKLLVSRRFGVPLMFIMLLGILWLTVWGANYPSVLLEGLANWIYEKLAWSISFFPLWLRGFLLDGVYATAARVICVMLPPMAIFFPLFTILEDIGYLPRMAFLFDPCMARCGGCGKQALTMCMGLGCNAVGVMGCRIINSPRERLSAILTNSMIPCNGRFPTLLVLGTLFFPCGGASLVVAACVALGTVGAVGVSAALNRTVLKAQPSSFAMEIPPFRRPRLGQILVRSLIDRTLFVAGRALCVAAPAGGVLWILANTHLLAAAARFLEPVGLFLGMNGVILLAFCLSLPANELLLPVILMILTGAGSLQQLGGVGNALLLQNLQLRNAVCMMVFTVFHWPCSTTLMTVFKETGSYKKTAAAFLLPTGLGVVLCALLNLFL